jgi:hypothetical protein
MNFLMAAIGHHRSVSWLECESAKNAKLRTHRSVNGLNASSIVWEVLAKDVLIENNIAWYFWLFFTALY